ncbi:RNA pseudouridine synthase [Perkinsela sp. CCAP 1560/4]|nr:RNA pseudouridine synthase [Perkinsela sp. CCAP 1560/4]|eukprot:KNH07390.1 RNA pseudouridine synthase [Perkinsela sp. CCAP 1560/4]
MNDADRLFRKYIWNIGHGPSCLISFLSSHFHYCTETEWLAKLNKQIEHLSDPSTSPTAADSALCLKINGIWAASAGVELKPGDVIETACEGSNEPPIADNYEVLHHDQDVLVVLKPQNLPVSQGGRYFYNTLEQLLNRTYRLFPGQKIYVIHRIDKETSGIVLLALNLRAAQILTSQGWHFKKLYEAIIVGHLPQRVSQMTKKDSLHVRYSITRAGEAFGANYSLDIPCLRKIRMRATLTNVEGTGSECVSIQYHSTDTEIPITCTDESDNVSPWTKGAKSAHTTVALLHHDDSLGLSFIQCKLETGRTHQIRVHVSTLGCPILGDKLYGQSNERFLQLTRREIEPLFDIPGSALQSGRMAQENIPGHLLHACEISFRHPTTNEVMTFTTSALESWKDHPSSLVRKFVETAR